MPQPFRTALLTAALSSLGCGPLFAFPPEDGADGSTSSAVQEPSDATWGSDSRPWPDTGSPDDADAADGVATGGDSGTTGLASTTDADLGSDADSGVSFLTKPDGGGGCSGDGKGGGALLECDLWAQDCPDGEKCVPWDNSGQGVFNATRCSTVVPFAGTIGDPCTVDGPGPCVSDDCEFGAFCYFVDPETNAGTCVAQCTGDIAEPTCAEPTECLIGPNGAHVLCLETCNPLAGDCGDGQLCVPASEDAFWCIDDAAATAGYLEACTQINQCVDSMVCLGTEYAGCDEAAMCCTPYCDLSLGNPNPGCPDAANGQTCTPWFPLGEVPNGFEDLGYCRAPAE